MPCAFCGLPFDKAQGRARSGEHVLPSWTLGYVPGEGGPITHSRQSSALGQFDQVWTADEFDSVASRVCEACNTDWMNDLENAARPFLIPMLQGHGKHLHRGGQELVAAWAVKTTLAVHLTTPEKAAPEEHYREMSRTHRPPPDTYVWLAAYDGSGPIAYHQSSELSGETPTGLPVKGYATTLAVGHFVFQVVGYEGLDEEVTFTAQGDLAQVVLGIRPFTGRIVWPPQGVLSWDALQAFGHVHETR